jgi:hypothetical protein
MIDLLKTVSLTSIEHMKNLPQYQKNLLCEYAQESNKCLILSKCRYYNNTFGLFCIQWEKNDFKIFFILRKGNK